MTMKLRYLIHAHWLRWPRRLVLAMPLLFIGTCVTKDIDAARFRFDECPYNEGNGMYGPGGLVSATAHG